jgi:hypothetical protein
MDDVWCCNVGLNYLVVVYIVLSSMFILNNNVVFNDTYIYDHNKYLMEKE